MIVDNEILKTIKHTTGKAIKTRPKTIDSNTAKLCLTTAVGLSHCILGTQRLINKPLIAIIKVKIIGINSNKTNCIAEKAKQISNKTTETKIKGKTIKK